MNNIARRSISLAAGVVLAISSLALAAPRAEAASRYFTIAGQVVKIDAKQRTLLIADRTKDRLYLVSLPEGSTLKITWGRYMRMSEPGFEDVGNKDRVEIRCFRTDPEHLARLDDGRQVIALTAASGK
jgi:hypothetical protein